MFRIEDKVHLEAEDQLALALLDVPVPESPLSVERTLSLIEYLTEKAVTWTLVWHDQDDSTESGRIQRRYVDLTADGFDHMTQACIRQVVDEYLASKQQ